jgi:hypothetical protein
MQPTIYFQSKRDYFKYRIVLKLRIHDSFASDNFIFLQTPVKYDIALLH